jgi:flap endonuclease-1
VYATATEDMDALTFRTPKLLRKMTFSSGQKQPIIEIDIAAVLSGLDLSYESFVDLCIMMGCDYCNTIKGVGPKTALILIRQHKNLENVVKALQRNPKTKNNVLFFVMFCLY